MRRAAEILLEMLEHRRLGAPDDDDIRRRAEAFRSEAGGDTERAFLLLSNTIQELRGCDGFSEAVREYERIARWMLDHGWAIG